MRISRNPNYLWAFFANIIMVLGEIFVISWLLSVSSSKISYSFNSYTSGMKVSMSLGIYLMAVAFIASSLFGVLQIIFDKDKTRKYVGYLNIFCPFFIFMIFVNLTMWRRSGLTKAQYEKGIHNFNVENIDKIIQSDGLKKTLSESEKKKIHNLETLHQMKLLTDYERNSIIYKVLIDSQSNLKLPIFYSDEEIFNNEVYK